MPDRPTEAFALFPDTTLTTARLTLRPPGEDDVDAIVAALADPELQRWLPLPNPYPRHDAVAWVRQIAPGARTEGRGLVRAIEWNGRLAGIIDCRRTDWKHRETEIGYWAVPAVRGRGLLTEAVTALARWALTDAGLARVVLRVATGNAASRRVAVKAGFTYEGTARDAGITHTGRVDLAIYSLIPADIHDRR